jgi:hypothetical protein
MLSQHMGTNTGYGNEGDFIASPRYMTAVAPTFDAAHNLSYICLTSAYDVAQFVVRALDMPLWETEMSMVGPRMRVHDLVEEIRACRSKREKFLPNKYVRLTYRIDRPWASIVHQDVPSEYTSSPFMSMLTLVDLQHQLNLAQTTGNGARYRQLSPLVATAEGRFDFVVPGYLNLLNPDIQTTTFRDWFLQNWASIP